MPSQPNLRPFGGHAPSVADRVFIDPSAQLIGQVQLLENTSMWPGAVLRADDDRIVIESGSGVLDLCLLEAPKGWPVIVGHDALVSHKACLHGACVASGAVIGIGAIVLDRAQVGAGALIGAGAVVPPGMVIPPATLVLGQPAKVIRQLTVEERERLAVQVAEVAAKARRYLEQG